MPLQRRRRHQAGVQPASHVHAHIRRHQDTFDNAAGAWMTGGGAPAQDLARCWLPAATERVQRETRTRCPSADPHGPWLPRSQSSPRRRRGGRALGLRGVGVRGQTRPCTWTPAKRVHVYAEGRLGSRSGGRAEGGGCLRTRKRLPHSPVATGAPAGFGCHGLRRVWEWSAARTFGTRRGELRSRGRRKVCHAAVAKQAPAGRARADCERLRDQPPVRRGCLLINATYLGKVGKASARARVGRGRG